MPAKRIVDAVSVGADQVICPCGKVIELEPEDPELRRGWQFGLLAAIGSYRLPQV